MESYILQGDKQYPAEVNSIVHQKVVSAMGKKAG